MVRVREAIIEDAKEIISFQKAMAWETEEYRLADEKVIPGVHAVFQNEGLGRYFVAENSGKVIASLLITYEWSDWRNTNVWWFQSVYVTPDFRRRGVFSLMYEFIRAEAEKNGVAGLRLYVESENSAARKTYEAMGMSSEHYTMYEWLR